MVKFNSVDEYKQEIHLSQPQGSLVRLTKMIADTRLSPNLKHISAVATFRNSSGEIVRLDKHCGDYWVGSGIQTASERADKVITDLEEFCKANGLDTRPGLFVDC